MFSRLLRGLAVCLKVFRYQTGLCISENPPSVTHWPMCDSPEMNPALDLTPTAILPSTGWAGVGVLARAATGELDPLTGEDVQLWLRELCGRWLAHS